MKDIIKLDTLDIFEFFQEGMNLSDAVKSVESQFTNAALDLTLGNKSEAADILGISKGKLHRILKEKENDH